MKNRDGSPKLPRPIVACGCTERRNLRIFRQCHGNRVCCNVYEGEECLQITEW